MVRETLVGLRRGGRAFIEKMKLKKQLNLTTTTILIAVSFVLYDGLNVN